MWLPSSERGPRCGICTGAHEVLNVRFDRKLHGFAAPDAVLTGVEDSAVVLAQGDGVCRLDYTPVPGHYSGAGDSFTALFTGNILNGNPPAKSARLAADTLCQWIDRYRQSPAPITGLPVERLWE